MDHPQTLKKIIHKMTALGVHVRHTQMMIQADPGSAKTNFAAILPCLYLLLNKFEHRYLIHIRGIPACLMPDAAEHLDDMKKNGIQYKKDKECEQCKYFCSCPGWPFDKQPIRRPPAIKNIPHEIAFEVTQKCNLNCPLCFNSQGGRDLPLVQIKQLLDECRELGIPQVRFTGGEPLLYEHLEAALSYARKKNLYVIVNTNATLLNEKTEFILKNYTDHLLISLQGFNPSSECRLTRTRTDFQRKLLSINRLKTLVPSVQLGTIISRTLIRHFTEYLYLITSLGIRNWGLFRPMLPTDSEEFCITPQHYQKLILGLIRQKPHGPNITIGNPIPFCITPTIKRNHYVLSGAEFDDGHNRLVVDVNGFLKPSYFIPVNLGLTIRESWGHPFITKVQSLDYLPQNCQTCGVVKWCKGGSRHWSRLTNDDYFKHDPLMKIPHHQ